MVDIVKLSYEIASGASVEYDDDTAVNPSQGGNAGRLAMRPIKRIFTISPGLDQSDTMVHVAMTRRRRYPFAIRDFANNYQLTNQTLPHEEAGSEVVLIGKTWTSGSLSVFERILLIDTTQTPFVVKKNGSTLTITTDYTFVNFGKINIPGLVDGDVVTVTGQYMVVVCYLDSPSTSIIKNQNGSTLHKFTEMRLEQIFEAELEQITA